MNKLSFLQIGFQKCGTTFLHKNVYPTNQNINCLQAVTNNDLERLLLNKLIIPDGLEYDKETFKKAFYEIIDKIFNAKKTNGIMFEPFTFLYQRRFDRRNVIDRIKTLYPDLKIITFIRSQSTWLISHYSQYIKSGGLLTLNDFIECQLSNPYLEAHYIDWYPLMSYLYKVFGKENVLICLYEDLKKSPQDIANKIFSFLEVSYSKINPERVNPSLSYYSLAFKRFINFFVRYDCGASNYSYFRDVFGARPTLASKIKHKFVYSYYKPYTNKICYKIDDIFKFNKKIILDSTQLNKIVKRYGENNEKLSTLINTSLKEYGYPII